jgi:hypothetical protein
LNKLLFSSHKIKNRTNQKTKKEKKEKKTITTIIIKLKIEYNRIKKERKAKPSRIFFNTTMKIITLITTFFTLLSSVKADPSVLFDATFIEEMSQFDLLKGRVVLYAEAKQTQLLEGNINLQIDEYVTTLEKLINDELDITSTDFTQDENRSYLRSDVHQVQDTDTPESAMSDATEAMEIGMGELARLNKEIKTLTTGLESSVRDMGSSISEFSSEDIVSYSLLIDKAVITVFVADNEVILSFR